MLTFGSCKQRQKSNWETWASCKVAATTKALDSSRLGSLLHIQ